MSKIKDRGLNTKCENPHCYNVVVGYRKQKKRYCKPCSWAYHKGYETGYHKQYRKEKRIVGP